jgi:hypothetical protein
MSPANSQTLLQSYPKIFHHPTSHLPRDRRKPSKINMPKNVHSGSWCAGMQHNVKLAAFRALQAAQLQIETFLDAAP